MWHICSSIGPPYIASMALRVENNLHILLSVGQTSILGYVSCPLSWWRNNLHRLVESFRHCLLSNAVRSKCCHIQNIIKECHGPSIYLPLDWIFCQEIVHVINTTFIFVVIQVSFSCLPLHHTGRCMFPNPYKPKVYVYGRYHTVWVNRYRQFSISTSVWII